LADQIAQKLLERQQSLRAMGILSEFSVVLNSNMNWNAVSIHTTSDSYPESATPNG